jgi:putative membrane protein insertion efficiency factor
VIARRRPAEGRLAGGGRRRRLAVVAILALSLALAVDLAQPPSAQLSARALLAGIRLYQHTGATWVERAGIRCRFQPTCSRYAAAAIARDGALVGAGRAGWRLLRCGPWTPAGTIDPP